MPTPPFARCRRAYLSALVAAVVLVALVGAFALGFYLRQAPTTSQTPLTVAHGWTLALRLSGTGPKAITGKNIEVGHKYGWRLTCTNTFNGWVSVKFNGVDESGGTTACSIRSTGTVLGPDAALTSPDPSPPIQTIEITVADSTAWEFALFIGTYYPPLTIDADWQVLHEEWNGTGPTFEVGLDVTLPKTWGLLYMCHGTGTIQIGLQSKSGVISPDITSTQSACDGQRHFNQYDQVSEGVNVALIDVTTGPENDWQVLLVGCVNGEPSCGITTSSL